MPAPLAEVRFTGPVIHWRGPAPFFFVAVPEDDFPPVRKAAREASYGWGCVPVTATIDGTRFTTSLFPKDGGYLLPLKSSVRKELGISLGDRVEVSMSVAPR